MNIFDRIKTEITPGTVIHREWTMKGSRTKRGEIACRRGEIALIYKLGNRSEKGINESEWNKAYGQLMATGCFSHPWFRKNMKGCYCEGGCNFNAIGGVFSVMGIARSAGKGMYLKITQAP